jgi:methionine biosynthesis protein MetW
MSASVEFEIIGAWINSGSRVLDLGCGDGELLSYLHTAKRVRGYGLDIDDAAVLAGTKRGINVIQSDLERGLAEFGDLFFDTVILSRTLQATRKTEALMREVLRVGKQAIVTIPNFGHWTTRWQLGIGGRMPVSKRLPYQWYDTPNVHFATLRDFDVFCKEKDIRILDRVALTRGQPVRRARNLRADTGMYRLQDGRTVSAESLDGDGPPGHIVPTDHSRDKTHQSGDAREYDGSDGGDGGE